MELIAAIYGGINPWWFLSLGILLIIFDFAAMESEYLSVFGLSILLAGIFNFLEINNALKIWFFPAALVLSYYLNDKIYSRLTNSPVPYSNIDGSIKGSSGRLEILTIESEDGRDFYKYKEKINIEQYSENEVLIQRIYRFRDNKGQIYPAEIATADENEEFVDGQEVFANDFVSGKVIISRSK